LFNEGFISLLQIMQVLNISIGLETSNYAQNADAKRVMAAENSIKDYAKAASSSKKTEQANKMMEYEIEEGIMYGPGIAD
jgi:hypothetical protein